MTTNFLPGDRVRYTGQATNRDCDATVEAHPDCPPEKVALRLANGLLFIADPTDCHTFGAPLVWPMAFPTSTR